MNNLEEIQAHISSDLYCYHPGKSINENCFADEQIADYGGIKTILSEHGFVIFNVKNKSLLATVRMLKEVSGQQVKHTGVNKKYIAKVEATNEGKFYINTAFSQPLHTDGGHQNQFPRFTSLLCVRPAQEGGVSTIIKASELLSELYSVFKDEVANLFNSDFIQIDTMHGTMNKLILFNLTQETIGISYTPVLQTIKTTKLGLRMLSFINHFIHDPCNQYRISLKQNDLLLMDNCRVLHGRTAFKKNDDRLLLRFWNEFICLKT